jgi:hypothetical protein
MSEIDRVGPVYESPEELAAEVVRLREDVKALTADLESATSVQVWPLARVLSEVRCGSQDWTWEEEWADLDERHAATGYLEKLEAQIRENGITMPVLVGNDGRLWGGHHRLRIAVRSGIPYVPVEITSGAQGAADDREARSYSRGVEDMREAAVKALLAEDTAEWALAGQHAGKDAARIVRDASLTSPSGDTPAPRDSSLTRTLRDAMKRYGVPTVMAEAGRLAQQRI